MTVSLIAAGGALAGMALTVVDNAGAGNALARDMTSVSASADSEDAGQLLAVTDEAPVDVATSPLESDRYRELQARLDAAAKRLERFEEAQATAHQ